jgi:hypothetical protein
MIASQTGLNIQRVQKTSDIMQWCCFCICREFFDKYSNRPQKKHHMMLHISVGKCFPSGRQIENAEEEEARFSVHMKFHAIYGCLSRRNFVEA